MKKIALEVISAAGEDLSNFSKIVIENEIRVGRDPSSTLVLNAPVVSGTHCHFFNENGNIYLVDSSSNGVFLNGADDPVERDAKTLVRVGDIFEVGEFKLRLSFVEENVLQSSHHIEFKEESQMPVKASEDSFNLDRFLEDWTKDNIGEELATEPSEVEMRDSQSFKQNKIDQSFNVEMIKTQEIAKTERQFSIPDHKTVEIEKIEHHVAPTSMVNETVQNCEDLDATNLFLRNLGLNPDSLNEKEKAQVIALGGRLLRVTLDGLITSLKLRTNIKEEIGANRTMVIQKGNNRLKFSVDVDDALDRLFRTLNTGFLAPEVSIKEAFKDLQKDQVTFIRSNQNTLEKVFTALAPENIIDNSSMSIFSNMKKWNLFVDRYEQTKTDLLGRKDKFANAIQSEYEKLTRGEEPLN